MEASAAAAPGDEYIFGVDTPVTATHPGEQSRPAISGDIAVWTDGRTGGGTGNPSRIFLKDLAKNETEQPLVAIPGNGQTIDGQNGAAISGNLVAWLQGYPAKIHYMFLSSGCPGQSGCDQLLEVPGAVPARLAVSGHRIVWEDARLGALQSDIYMYDLDNPGPGVQPVTTASSTQQFPAIDGDWVVWVDNRGGSYWNGTASNNDIFAKNVVTGEERRLTSDGRNSIQESPRISGGLVVWDINSGFNNTSPGGVWLSDLNTGETRRIFDDTGADFTPDVEGDKIVWEHQPAGAQSYEIWLHDLGTGVTQTVSSGSSTKSLSVISSTHIIWQDNHIGNAIYQNRLGDTARQLAGKYSPELYLHHEEYFEPRAVGIMLAGEGTRLMQNTGGVLKDDTVGQWPDLSPEQLGLFSSAQDEPGSGVGGKYIDLPGSLALAWGFPTEWMLRRDYVDRYRGLAQSDLYPETVYARVYKEPGQGGRVALQYWMSYYFNNFNSYHEGDWELAEVVLGGDLQPQAVGLSEHIAGKRRQWSYVEGTGSHPVVYVARGSHAGYFAAGDYRVQIPFLPDATDRTEANGPVRRPAVEVLPDFSSSRIGSLGDGPYGWLAYQGAWGELTSLPEGDGPQGPAATPEHNDIWDNPLAWFDSLEWDGEPREQGRATGNLEGSVTREADVHLYDDRGRHVGKNTAGGIDRQIPGVDYVEIPESGIRSVIVHKNAALPGLRFVLTPAGTGEAVCGFTLAVPKPGLSRVETALYQSILLAPGGRAEIDPATTGFALDIDNDGDNIYEAVQQPAGTAVEPLDLNPPAVTTDLSVTAVTSDSVSVAFSPSSDGDAGGAVYYDIRYSTSPITEESWRDAEPLQHAPVVPATAGGLEDGSAGSAAIGGLNAGTAYYFALKTSDGALHESVLSNVAAATTAIPQMTWSGKTAYWATLADYLDRELSVDYELGNTGSGTAKDATIQSSLCLPGSVNLSTPMPLTVGDLAQDTARTVTLKYQVSPMVCRFMAITHADCRDDAGRTYYYPEVQS